MKAHTQRKATKTFSAIHILAKERKRLSQKDRVYLLTQKNFDGKLQEFVAGIFSHESKRLYAICQLRGPYIMKNWVLSNYAKDSRNFGWKLNGKVPTPFLPTRIFD